MPILEKVCISLYLGLFGPYWALFGPYLVPIGPYLVPIWSLLGLIWSLLGPIWLYWALFGPIGPYWALFGSIGPYLALTVKQKRNTEGPDRGHRTKCWIALPRNPTQIGPPKGIEVRDLYRCLSFCYRFGLILLKILWFSMEVQSELVRIRKI